MIFRRPECDPEMLRRAARDERWRYRGHEFTITRSGFTWWCHSGISVPRGYRHPNWGCEGNYPWELAMMAHEAGWATTGPRRLTHELMVRKLCRCIDGMIREALSKNAVRDEHMDARMTGLLEL